MMNGINDYFYILENFSQEDLEIIRRFYFEKIEPIHESIESPHQNNKGSKVSYFPLDDLLTEDIKQIKQKYPVLGNNCLVHTLVDVIDSAIHIDGDAQPGNQPQHLNRMCALNFPIKTTTDSHTVFYGLFEDYESEYFPNYRLTYPKDGQNLVEKVRLNMDNKPVLINTKTWHNVLHRVNEKRIILSWSCTYSKSYSTIRDILIQTNQ